MSELFARSALLFGQENMEKLYAARVAVFGIGGVGGHCAEALARSGIGSLTLFDRDCVAESNINRQIIATTKTIGKPKAALMAARIREINTAAQVTAHEVFYMPENADRFPLTEYDYIVDAIDNVTAKLTLITRAAQAATPIISSMGAAGKTDPTAFAVADIFQTSVCPLARVMRRELRARGVCALKVVYSTEPPKPSFGQTETDGGHPRPVPASCAFVPPVAGLILAGEVVKDLLAGGGA